MGEMYRFEKLDVWQKAMEFCKLVYEKSKDFPKEEKIAELGRLLQALLNSLKKNANNQKLKAKN